MLTAILVDTLEVKNQLGEGVIWDSDTGAAWWTDIDGMTLYRYGGCDRWGALGDTRAPWLVCYGGQ